MNFEGNLARVTSKGQITIPKKIRDKINAHEGDYLLFQLKGKKVEMEKASVSSAEEFENLTQKVQKKFESLKIAKQDIEKAIKWARKQKK